MYCNIFKILAYIAKTRKQIFLELTEVKVQVVDDSLNETDPLNKWHPLSEAYNSLSGLGNP